MASAVTALLRPLLRALTPLHEASACHLLSSAVSLLLQQYQEAVAATPPAAAARRAVASANAALAQHTSGGGGGGGARHSNGRGRGGSKAPAGQAAVAAIQATKRAGPGSSAHMLATQVGWRHDCVLQCQMGGQII